MEIQKSLKSKLKYLLLLLCFIPCLFVFSACGQSAYLVNIEKTQTEGLVDTYTMTYSDGSKKTFNVSNGEKGQDLTFEQIYRSAVSQGYNGDYWKFLKEYLTLSVDENNSTQSTHKAMLSAVSVYSEFPIITEQNTYGYDMFRGYYVTGTEQIKSISVSAGSGVIWQLDKETGSAYIVTNYHVVYNDSSSTTNKIARTINVYLYGNNQSVSYLYDENKNYIKDADGFAKINYGQNYITCEYVGGSMTYDLAVLKVDNNALLKNNECRAVDIATGYGVGETAVAIGNPEADGISATSGVISVDSEYITMNGADDKTKITFRVMRVDTAINSGNSGGGLFNKNGELIGIVNAKVTKTTIENMAYSIPINLVTKVIRNIVDNASSHIVKKSDLGLSLGTKDSMAVINEETGLTKIIESVYVTGVAENSLASSIGLLEGDIINKIAINTTSTNIERMYQAIDIALDFRVDEHIYFYVIRNDNEVILDFVVSDSNIKDIL